MKIAVAVVVVLFGKHLYVGSISLNPAYLAGVTLLALGALVLIAMFHMRELG